MLSKEQILNNPFIPKARITLLRYEDETPYAIIEGDIIGGSLQISRNNGVRRSCNIQLSNVNQRNLPAENRFWVNRKFMLELGQYIGDTIDYIPQGIFVTGNPQVESLKTHSTVEINGIDKFSLLNGNLGGNLETTYIVTNGTDVNVAVLGVLNNYLDENSQFPVDAKSPILQVLPSEFQYTPYTITHTTNLGEILLELCGTYSRNMYYNTLGRLVFEDNIDDKIKGSTWHFNTNEFLYLGATREYEFDKLYNKVVVQADNANGNSFYSVAVNNNPASNTNINKIGVKIAPTVQDNLIFRQDLCDIRATYELKKMNAMLSSVSISSVPFFGLDVDQVVTLTDEKLGLENERFVIQEINIPLKFNEEMTVSVVKTMELETDLIYTEV